jgi:hypothetical protein
MKAVVMGSFAGSRALKTASFVRQRCIIFHNSIVQNEGSLPKIRKDAQEFNNGWGWWLRACRIPVFGFLYDEIKDILDIFHFHNDKLDFGLIGEEDSSDSSDDDYEDEGKDECLDDCYLIYLEMDEGHIRHMSDKWFDLANDQLFLTYTSSGNLTVRASNTANGNIAVLQGVVGKNICEVIEAINKFIAAGNILPTNVQRKRRGYIKTQPLKPLEVKINAGDDDDDDEDDVVRLNYNN